MEQIKTNLHAIANQIKPSEAENSKMTSWQQDSLNVKKPDAVYLAVVMRIVRRTLELSNQPPLSDESLKERACVWAETLFDVVPETRLVDAMDQAVKDHESSFPINAYDLKLAYDKFAAVERAAQMREREKRINEIEELRRLRDAFECKKCFNSGWESVKIDGYSYAKKCYACKYWEFWSDKHVKKT